MRPIDWLGPRFIRLVPAAAISAALFVPWLSASAQEGCPPGGCPLPPPQSREVNPSPTRADGSTVEIATAGDLPPLEISVHVLAPAFVEPAPFGASFETIPVEVRFQDPGDASCGIQALGMALDALPGSAPTSSAMLGLLQDNGMMYDFGTGVEELAYAAQSYGYKGSFAFHGASLDQPQAQLATGSPVVVSLGANGAGAPGHFVTVTGISADGGSHGDASRWVAYNDPTLGKQVLPASEFARLWEMQGNSGVAVATEPPPEAGDPEVLALWAAFAAGLMALVSTTPLGKFRQGIGGRLDSGGGGRSAPAPRSAPPKKEKEKEKEKEPKKPKARFDDEIAVVSAPPKATKARFDTEPPSGALDTGKEPHPIAYSPSRATQGASASTKEYKPQTGAFTPSRETQGTSVVAQATGGEAFPTATPVPPGCRATRTTTPTAEVIRVAPVSTPSAWELETLYQQGRLRAATYHDYSGEDIAALLYEGSLYYDRLFREQHNTSLTELVAPPSPHNNPIAVVMPGLEPATAMNKTGANTRFIKALGLEVSHYPNYDPIYLKELQITYPRQYEFAMAGEEDPILLGSTTKAFLGPGYADIERLEAELERLMQGIAGSHTKE